MENIHNLSEEEKHRKAYNELKEIQRKYGFENIIELRKFHGKVSRIFFEYDRVNDSVKWEEFEPLFKEVFKFFSDMDTMEESEIQDSYNILMKKLTDEKISPKIIGFINEAYISRMSDTERLRRKIIKEGLDLQKTLSEHYTSETQKQYRLAMRNAFEFAYDFPTEYSDWGNLMLEKEIYDYKYKIKELVKSMERANIPEPIIKDFLRPVQLIPEYQEKIRKAKENKSKNGLN